MRFEVDWADVGNRRPLHRLEPDGTGNRSNDGRADPAGRFVLGTMHEDAAAGRTTGSLYRVDEQVTALRTGIGIPNGLAFDAQRGLVYWADTFTARIIVADYDTTDGTWHDERTFFDYADAPGRPDGACLDTEGGYWSASVTGWCVTRIDPDGTVTDRIDVPLEEAINAGVRRRRPHDTVRDDDRRRTRTACDTGSRWRPTRIAPRHRGHRSDRHRRDAIRLLEAGHVLGIVHLTTCRLQAQGKRAGPHGPLAP